MRVVDSREHKTEENENVKEVEKKACWLWGDKPRNLFSVCDLDYCAVYYALQGFWHHILLSDQHEKRKWLIF